jgi:energy-converting hydrogenase Eha subunit A
MNEKTNNYHTFLTKPWWSMGQALPQHCGLWINETATRARAGLLNVLSATTIFLLLAAPETDPVRFVGPFVIFDMVTAAVFGLTPISPAGILGTAITMKLPPVWKPTQPKRFAWALGATLGVCCVTFWILGMNKWVIGVLAICFTLTWLESVLGFCVGCWMYSLMYKCETCRIG